MLHFCKFWCISKFTFSYDLEFRLLMNDKYSRIILLCTFLANLFSQDFNSKPFDTSVLIISLLYFYL